MFLDVFQKQIAVLDEATLAQTLSLITTTAATSETGTGVSLTPEFRRTLCEEAGLSWNDILQSSSGIGCSMPLTQELALALSANTIYPVTDKTFSDKYYLEYLQLPRRLFIKYQTIIGSRVLGYLSEEQHQALRERLVAELVAYGKTEAYRQVCKKAAAVREAIALRNACAAGAAAPAAATTKVPGAVRAQLGMLRAEGSSLFLPTKVMSEYAAVKRLLEKAGAKYVTRNKSFAFPAGRDAQEMLDQLLGGKRVNPKKDFQFFASTELVTRLMRAQLPDLQGLAVLEPSAGDGALADLARDMGAQVTTVELWDENVSKLRAKGYKPLERDFLQVTSDDTGLFDAIMANPPFTGGKDIEHFMHMLKFLKPGGTLCCVMSTAWQNGSTKKPTAFRKFLETQDVVIDELPPGTFAESGTGVGAVMLTLRASATADACTNEVVAELA